MIRFTALLLTALTGFAGLVYEVVWQKVLATLLGSHSEATAAVLAIFLGGLSVGYAAFGALTRRLVARERATGRPARLLLVYGLAELGIGVYAALLPTLFGSAEALSLWVPLGHPGVGFAFDVALSALLIGPPAILMGGTIPILTLALAGDLAHATGTHALVYGANTLGAFAGALAAAFGLVPSLGLDGTLYAMAGVNAAAGIAFAALDRGGRRIAPDFAEPAVAAAPPNLRAYALAALLAGFAMMTLQTSFNRVGALAFGSSQFTFAMIVAVFVLCIALGSLAVSALPRVPSGLLAVSQWLLVLLLCALYLQLEDAPYWAHRLRVAFERHDGAFYPYQLFVFASLFAVLILPIGLSGALLPLIFDRLRREVGDLGAVAGRLYAWNTVGSLAGALLGGYVLLIWLDLHHVYRIAVAALALGAAIITALSQPRSRGWLAPAAAAPVALALVAFPAWSPDRLSSGLFRVHEAQEFTFLGPDVAFRSRRPAEVVFYDDDPTTSVSVHRIGGERGARHQSHSLLVNGKPDGNVVSDYVTTSFLGLLPALMARAHERCFVVGFGTGVTASELAALEQTRRVDVAEISRGVIEAAPIFDYANLRASGNPKLTIHRGDAYRTLKKDAALYDVIVSEPSNPWVTGVEMLFSREFLQAARSHLTPGGVYAQWFHLYESDEQSVATVLRTFASVFPHVSIWYGQGTDLVLLGFDEPSRALDTRALAARFARPDFAAGFQRAGMPTLEEVFAHELLPLGTLHARPDPGRIHTLWQPILSYQAALAFFRGRTAALPRGLDPASTTIGARNSLLRRYAGVGAGDPLPDRVLELALHETCKYRSATECTTLLAGWLHQRPDSELRGQAVAQLRQTLGQAIATPGVVAQVSAFFGAPDARLHDAQAPLPVAQLLQITNQYVRYYHHALPFQRATLQERWRYCAGPTCRESARRVEQQLGFPIDAGTKIPAVAAAE